jgi:AcrR family transcriptional regulator
MAVRGDGSVETRAPLSRERILQAAIDLADAGGISSLTMRRLGQELGVEAMSLYNHVANKDDLLNGMLEQVLLQIAMPPEGNDWKAAIRATALSAHAILLRHSWACRLMMEPGRDSNVRLQWMDAVLGCFRHAGFSAMLTHHAYHALDSHITGFTLWLVNLPARGEDLQDLAAAFLQDVSLDEYPHLVEHIELHLREIDHEDESEFEFGLGLILDGLERLRDSA